MAIGLLIVSIADLVLSSSVVDNDNKQAEAQQAPQQQQQAPTIEIPISKGYIDGKIAYFIATDASDRQAVESITNNTGYTYRTLIDENGTKLYSIEISADMTVTDKNDVDVEGEQNLPLIDVLSHHQNKELNAALPDRHRNS